LYSTPTEKVESIIAKGMLQLRENSKETVGFDGDFERVSAPEIQANVEEDDEFNITVATLAPPFLKSVNPTLEAAISADEVFQHPAIRLLGVLDTIISELE
jgi:hypothetical protein